MSKTQKNLKRRWLFISVAILFALVAAAIVIPNFIRARTSAAMNACINNLRHMDSAIQQWALEYQKKPEDKITMPDIAPYLKDGDRLRCPQSGIYTVGPAVSNGVTCSFPGHTLPQ
ncbi:MAG: prepilin-type cleavage/methylation domain-containing protein [Verrucomicrobiota bacterium]